MAINLTRRDFVLATAAMAASTPLVSAHALGKAGEPEKSRLILLGTAGGPTPKPNRAAPSQVIVVGGASYVVDCGNGVARQMALANLRLGSIRGVFLTHHHSDHISDLATLAIARWASGCATPLTVHAPEGPAARFADTCLAPFDDDCFLFQAAPHAGPRPRIEVTPFRPSSDVETVMDRGGWTVRTTLVEHHPIEPATGYRVERSGYTIMISGDTRVCAGVRALADNADVIVHEALLAARVTPKLLTWNASAESVGALAAAVRPATLVLTHLIPAPTTDEHESAYLADVRRGGFDGHTVVARDLTTVVLPRVGQREATR